MKMLTTFRFDLTPPNLDPIPAPKADPGKKAIADKPKTAPPTTAAAGDTHAADPKTAATDTAKAPEPAKAPSDTTATATATTPAPAASVKPADTSQSRDTTGFTAAPEPGADEKFSGSTLLVEAYAAIWLVMMAWLLLIWRKSASLTARLDGLESALDRAEKRAAKPAPVKERANVKEKETAKAEEQAS